MKNKLPVFLLVGILILAFLARYLYDKQKYVSTPTPIVNNNTLKIGETRVNFKPAKTSEEITLGLGGTTHLDDYEGMLFYLAANTNTSFWMKDMLIPIDIIWINDGKVTGIEKSVEPQPDTPDYKLELYPSPGGVDYVLEVNAGFSKKNNIKVGDKMIL